MLGAAIAWFAHVPRRVIAVVMAFGSGVLMSALAFDLMDQASIRGGFASTALGFLGSAVAVAAIFLPNIPEGLSSAAGMKQAGRSARYAFGVWTGIAVISGVASLLGYTLFRRASLGVVAATTATSAGAILAMLANTRIPEAFEVAHDFGGGHHGGRLPPGVRAHEVRRRVIGAPRGAAAPGTRTV